MTGIQDILNRIDSKDKKIIHISSEKDRKQNKEYWRNYNRILKNFGSNNYKNNDWFDTNEYIYDHCESDY